MFFQLLFLSTTVATSLLDLLGSYNNGGKSCLEMSSFSQNTFNLTLDSRSSFMESIECVKKVAELERECSNTFNSVHWRIFVKSDCGWTASQMQKFWYFQGLSGGQWGIQVDELTKDQQQRIITMISMQDNLVVDKLTVGSLGCGVIRNVRNLAGLIDGEEAVINTLRIMKENVILESLEIFVNSLSGMTDRLVHMKKVEAPKHLTIFYTVNKVDQDELKDLKRFMFMMNPAKEKSLKFCFSGKLLQDTRESVLMYLFLYFVRPSIVRVSRNKMSYKKLVPLIKVADKVEVVDKVELYTDYADDVRDVKDVCESRVYSMEGLLKELEGAGIDQCQNLILYLDAFFRFKINHPLDEIQSIKVLELSYNTASQNMLLDVVTGLESILPNMKMVRFRKVELDEFVVNNENNGNYSLAIDECYCNPIDFQIMGYCVCQGKPAKSSVSRRRWTCQESPTVDIMRAQLRSKENCKATSGIQQVKKESTKIEKPLKTHDLAWKPVTVMHKPPPNTQEEKEFCICSNQLNRLISGKDCKDCNIRFNKLW